MRQPARPGNCSTKLTTRGGEPGPTRGAPGRAERLYATSRDRSDAVSEPAHYLRAGRDDARQFPLVEPDAAAEGHGHGQAAALLPFPVAEPSLPTPPTGRHYLLAVALLLLPRDEDPRPSLSIFFNFVFFLIFFLGLLYFLFLRLF